MITLNQSMRIEQLRYTDTDSFIIHIITGDYFEDIADDVTKWFDTSNYDENDKKPLPIGMNKKYMVELGGKIIKKIVALRAKTYACLIDDDGEEKKAEGTKMCVIKGEVKFKNYKDCLFNNKIILKSQQTFKSDHQNLYTIR